MPRKSIDPSAAWLAQVEREIASGKHAPRRGRPIVADAARSAPVQVRLSPQERATLRARCEARGMTVSDALRDLARRDGLLD